MNKKISFCLIHSPEEPGWESKIKIPHRSGPGPLEPPSAGVQAYAEYDKFDQCIFLTASRRFSRKERVLRKMVQMVRSKPGGSAELRDLIDRMERGLAESNAEERPRSPARTSGSQSVRRRSKLTTCLSISVSQRMQSMTYKRLRNFRVAISTKNPRK